jgi:hypothetical protein
MRLGNIATFTAQFEVFDPEVMARAIRATVNACRRH